MRKKKHIAIRAQKFNVAISDYRTLFNDIKGILENAQYRAYKTVDNIRVQTYWQIGERIVREELRHKERADYGAKIILKLAGDLNIIKRDLYRMLQFYKAYPIMTSLMSQLSWTHYVILVGIKNSRARKFYEEQTMRNNWSVRELGRQIKSGLYERVRKQGKVIVKYVRCPELPEKIAVREKRRFYLFFDEFGDISKYDGQEILKFMRSIMQRQKSVICVFAGSQESIMREIFQSKKQPFFQFALYYNLGQVGLPIFKKYLANKFRTLNVEIDSDIIETILQKTAGHPFYTMLLSKLLYLKTSVGEKCKISDLISEAICTEKPYLEISWERLSEKKNYREVVKYLANKNQKGMFTDARMKKINLPRILRDLQKMGFVEKRQNRYEFIDPLFSEYVKSISF